MSACQAQFERVPRDRRDTTHTCARLPKHDGPHVCPMCQNQWVESPEGNRVVAVASR